MGQGACQGIEDAYYFNHLLKKTNLSIPHTFEVFEQNRRKKVDYVVNNSWNFGKMSHSPLGQFFLRGIMKLMPESAMKQQMNTLYEVEEF